MTEVIYDFAVTPPQIKYLIKDTIKGVLMDYISVYMLIFQWIQSNDYLPTYHAGVSSLVLQPVLGFRSTSEWTTILIQAWKIGRVVSK